MSARQENDHTVLEVSWTPFGSWCRVQPGSLVGLQLRYNLVGLLVEYLRDTKATCFYQKHPLPSRQVRAGMTQGSIIFPTLFNHFVSDCPINYLDMTFYADDFTLLVFSSSIVEAERRANQLPTISYCYPEIQRDSIHFSRIPTSPCPTLKCESVTRWHLRIKALKS